MTSPASTPSTCPLTLRVVLYEDGGSRPLEGKDRLELLRALLDRGYAVSRLGAGGRTPEEGALLVLGRFSGEKPGALLRGENPGEAEAWGGAAVHFQDVEGLDLAGILEAVEGARSQLEIPPRRSWKPWFPVIDYSRCTNCMQCLSFCLFDVYGVSAEGKIQVRNQDHCKTDCPACSRVCPEVAILFPKYRQGPINGDEIDPEDLRREAMKVDISALLGGDIYAALRDRSARAHSRFSKERDEARALKERERCLEKLKDSLDIPPEVLASLPKAEEIQARAEAAMARARAREAGGSSEA